MSSPRIPAQAQLYLSILSSRWDDFWPALRTDLEARLGPVDYESEPMPLTQTAYYDKELGTPILRRALGFGPLVDQDSLPDIKLWTNSLEAGHALPDGRRLFNLDPGLLTLERLVLATGKNFTHRIYLHSGIWGDLTLIFRGRAWRNLPWTFPDYAGPELQTHLTCLRDNYRRKLNRLRMPNY